MNSFIGIFQGLYLDIKNAVLSPPMLPHVSTQSPPPSDQILKHSIPLPPSKFSTPMGNPGQPLRNIFESVHWQIQFQTSNLYYIYITGEKEKRNM